MWWMEPDSLQRFVIFVFCWFPVGILWCEVDAAMSRCYVVPRRKVLIHSEYGLAVCCFQHHRKFLSLVSLFASIHHDGVPGTVALFVVKLSVFSGNRLHREWLDRVDGSHYIHISCRFRLKAIETDVHWHRRRSSVKIIQLDIMFLFSKSH